MGTVRVWVFMPHPNNDMRPWMAERGKDIKCAIGNDRRPYALILERLGEEVHESEGQGQVDVKVGRRQPGHCKFRGRSHCRKTSQDCVDNFGRSDWTRTPSSREFNPAVVTRYLHKI